MQHKTGKEGTWWAPPSPVGYLLSSTLSKATGRRRGRETCICRLLRLAVFKLTSLQSCFMGCVETPPSLGVSLMCTSPKMQRMQINFFKSPKAASPSCRKVNKDAAPSPPAQYPHSSICRLPKSALSVHSRPCGGGCQSHFCHLLFASPSGPSVTQLPPGSGVSENFYFNISDKYARRQGPQPIPPTTLLFLTPFIGQQKRPNDIYVTGLW